MSPSSSHPTDPGAAVDSVFGRTGTVTAQTGDYAVAQVTGAAPAASPTFTGTVTVGAGTTQNLYTATTGALVNAAVGTVASPDTATNPATKISRLLSVTGSISSPADQLNAGQFITVGDANNRNQVEGITAEAQNSAVASDTAGIGPDAVGVYAVGRVTGTGATGRGTGAYVEGRADVTTGFTMGVEVRSNNNSGSANTFSSSGASTSQGLWLTAQGSKSGAAISIGGVSNTQWDAGIVITSVGSSGPVATASIADYSSSTTSIAINGTHTTAAAVAAGAGKVLIGGTTQISAASLLEVQGANSSGDPLVNIGSTANLQPYTVRVRNSSGQLIIGIVGATNNFLTGSTAGDSVLVAATSSHSLLIGGTTPVINVKNDNTLSFFGVTTTAQIAGGTDVLAGLVTLGLRAASSNPPLNLGTGLVTSGGTNTAGGAAVASQSFSSGTAAQLSQTTQNALLITTVTLGGTLTLAIGPTSGVANTIVNAAAVTTGEVISTFIPAGWFVKYTLTTATISSQAITM